ncbi:hypothetical protein LUX32_25755 [Actinomadura madurae]|nr:hypothetical protein [Actinomadura madurae]MCP9980635.1 hypothetical protein [Actinomadura madurae]
MLFGHPVVHLVFQDGHDARVVAEVGDELLRGQEQGVQRVHRDDGGRAAAQHQRGTFAEDVAGAAEGDDPLAAVPFDADPDRARLDHDGLVGGLALGPQHRADRVHDLARGREERGLLDRREGRPEPLPAGGLGRPGGPRPRHQLGVDDLVRVVVAGVVVH